jgi:hypothetical protein
MATPAECRCRRYGSPIAAPGPHERRGWGHRRWCTLRRGSPPQRQSDGVGIANPDRPDVVRRGSGATDTSACGPPQAQKMIGRRPGAPTRCPVAISFVTPTQRVKVPPTEEVQSLLCGQCRHQIRPHIRPDIRRRSEPDHGSQMLSLSSRFHGSSPIGFQPDLSRLRTYWPEIRHC